MKASQTIKSKSTSVFTMFLQSKNMYKVLFQLVCPILMILGDEDSFLAKFHQSQYKIKEIRTEMISYDKDAFHYFDVKTFKFNRSMPAINATMMSKADLDGHKANVLVQAFKFASNEYRTFPLRFQVNLYKAVKSNIAGIKDALKCGNFPKDTVMRKDVKYYVCNIVFDDAHLPPLIPVGKYMIQLTLFNQKRNYVVGNVFGEAYVPIKISD